MSRHPNRRGFTLVELLVVSVLGSILVLVTYNVLITNQRAYTVQNAEIGSQQNIRSALQVMLNELREVSAVGGDISNMNSTSVKIRSMKDFGVVCQVGYSMLGVPTIRVLNKSDRFTTSDSLFVFADNDEAQSGDDTWLRVTAAVSDTSGVSCVDPSDAQNLTFSGLAGLFAADSVRAGAPVRSFEYYTWGQTIWNNQYYLGRRGTGDPYMMPVAGPLMPYGQGVSNPITFRYLDENGSVTGTPADVRQIEVKVKTWSQVADRNGDNLVDSVTVRVFTRN